MVVLAECMYKILGLSIRVFFKIPVFNPEQTVYSLAVRL